MLGYLINIDNNSEINYYHNYIDHNNCNDCIDIISNSIATLFIINKLDKNSNKLVDCVFNHIGLNAQVLVFQQELNSRIIFIQIKQFIPKVNLKCY